MADTMQFDLVSPERRLASAEVTEVRIPGADGDMTIMASHAPTITTLRPGLLTVIGPDGETQYAVTGGFAEIGESVTVLAERALPRSEFTQERFDAFYDEAEESARAAKNTPDTGNALVDDAVKLLADMEALGTHVGLSTRQPNL
ncbi:ATP synthase F1 subcomplex epsilon subunit [Hasllibacter halocynthiae]|uniref:ATP synthase epsilon chain n=1 Tax=Hasllibacter halocynthiae TaxID=595589 RepID=A0A2T0X0Y6_9RHOB|nr:F0F1 ATP synthase subunit epsilon [Hasllibacter halocynthiae]PRY92609.1 ATP synthase F1 subcomplex epsilon subunit [Hasllibacter halocynthiae]